MAVPGTVSHAGQEKLHLEASSAQRAAPGGACTVACDAEPADRARSESCVQRYGQAAGRAALETTVANAALCVSRGIGPLCAFAVNEAMDYSKKALEIKNIEREVELCCSEIQKAVEDAVLLVRNSFHSQLIRMPRKLRATRLCALFTAEELQTIGYVLQGTDRGSTVETCVTQPTASQSSSSGTRKHAKQSSRAARALRIAAPGTTSLSSRRRAVQASAVTEATRHTDSEHGESQGAAVSAPQAPAELETALRHMLEQLLAKQKQVIGDGADHVPNLLLDMLREKVFRDAERAEQVSPRWTPDLASAPAR